MALSGQQKKITSFPKFTIFVTQFKFHFIFPHCSIILICFFFFSLFLFLFFFFYIFFSLFSFSYQAKYIRSAFLFRFQIQFFTSINQISKRFLFDFQLYWCELDALSSSSLGYGRMYYKRIREGFVERRLILRLRQLDFVIANKIFSLRSGISKRLPLGIMQISFFLQFSCFQAISMKRELNKSLPQNRGQQQRVVLDFLLLYGARKSIILGTRERNMELLIKLFPLLLYHFFCWVLQKNVFQSLDLVVVFHD